MRELLVVVIPCLLLAAVGDHYSVYKRGTLGEKVYIHKENIFLIIMTVCMILLVGLRTNYNDTFTYIYGYEMMSNEWNELLNAKLTLGDNPGFVLVNSLLRIIGVSTQNFLMIYAIITISIYVWFILKYTDNIFFSIFLFFTMGCYTFTMAAIKQTVAVAFCLIATDRAINKKKVSFLFWVGVAAAFHPYSLMYLIVPILTFSPWSAPTYLMIGVFGVLGMGLESLLGTIVNVTSMMGEGYTMESFSGDGVNVFRLVVIWVPVLLSFLARGFWQRSEEKVSNIIMNLTLLNAEIMFIALFGTANYFARLANYFLIFQTILLPRLLKYFEQRTKKILIIGATVGYSLYFFYAEGIAQGGFDYLYDGISLLEYLQLF